MTWSHWMPPEVSGYAPVRFATWFFVAHASDAGEVVVDGGEIHEHAWLRPSEALAKRDAGEIELAPPTFTTLCQLAMHLNVEDVLAAGRAQEEPPRYHTHIAMRDGVRILMWHGDAGYETSDADAPGPRNRVVWEGPVLVWDRSPS